MRNETPEAAASLEMPTPDRSRAAHRWEPPSVEVICLACEISAYAPDGDLPLF